MPIDVWFVMLPGVLSLDMTGPAETFVLAGDAFRLHYIGPQPEVPTSIGLTMSGIQPLPESLDEALKIMEKSDFVASVLGEHAFEYFLRNKRQEWNEYRRQVTPFELKKYLPKL